MSTIQVATFLLGEVLWGINVLQIREVIRQAEYSPVPHAPAPVRGLMNLRGQIVTVVDLGQSVGSAQPQAPWQTCIILKTDAELAEDCLLSAGVERTGADPVGLLVEQIGDVVEVDEEELGVPPANSTHEDSHFIQAVVQLDDELLLLLALAPVLEEAYDG